MMWPLYFLLSKVLGIADEEEPDSAPDNSSFLDSYPFNTFPTNGKFLDEVLPCSVFVEVPHINQLHSWDCGLACISMAMTTLGINNCDIQALIDLCSTTSIWTVDLAYILQKFSVAFSYFTVTFGANPNYAVEIFYKEQLANDLDRVDTLFQKALEAGIDIQCRSLSAKEISLLILSRKYIAIVLVDQYKLSQSWVEEVCLSGFGSPGYAGHYILICGYDTKSDEFEIRDPASSRMQLRISSKRLEQARKSFGTDEDLLLISLENNKKQPIAFRHPSSVDTDS